MDKLYCIYEHLLPNGKRYIGITSGDPKCRWANGAGYKENKPFWKDILHYGWVNVSHKIIATNLTEIEARKQEAELIRQFDLMNPAYGYNQECKTVHDAKQEKVIKCDNFDRTLLKSKMTLNGDLPFVSCLADILQISRQTASNKLNSVSSFNEDEIRILVERYNYTSDELKNAIVKE